MKYGSAAAYDEAKRRSEFARARKQAREAEERVVDPERIKQIADGYKRLAEEMAAKDAKEKKEAEDRSTAHTLRANKICALNEWRSIGVQPPQVDAEGFPTVSLSFYISLGWRIGIVDGYKALIPPEPAPDPRTRETRYNEMGS